MLFQFSVTFISGCTLAYDIEADTLVSASAKLDLRLGALVHLVEQIRVVSVSSFQKLAA